MQHARRTLYAVPQVRLRRPAGLLQARDIESLDRRPVGLVSEVADTGLDRTNLRIEVSAVTFGFVGVLPADAPVLSLLFELVNSAAGLPGGLVWLLTGDSPGEARLLPNAVTRISDVGLV